MIMELLRNLDKVHTTEMGVDRIKRNIEVDVDDIVAYCIDKIKQENAVIEKKGKNYYVSVDGIIITVNASSYTIITAHKEKKQIIKKQFNCLKKLLLNNKK